MSSPDERSDIRELRVSRQSVPGLRWS